MYRPQPISSIHTSRARESRHQNTDSINTAPVSCSLTRHADELTVTGKYAIEHLEQFIALYVPQAARFSARFSALLL